MKIMINTKNKKDLFVALFHTLKNCSNIVSIIFKSDHIYIQGMDKSHICLYEVKLLKQWFSIYEYKEEDINTISFDAQTFYTIINRCHDTQNMELYFDGNSDILNIDLDCEYTELSKGVFNKYFKIPLVDFDNIVMEIPENADYDSEFSIISKKICEITSQMIVFGNDINFKCFQDQIHLITNGTNGEMLVKVPIDDLNEYSIIEDEIVDIRYSLTYIDKMCLSNKLSDEIQFSLSKEFPMKIKYDLGDDSSIVFYIASKIDE
jgi:proliferating cell nuclear antigen PCNA